MQGSVAELILFCYLKVNNLNNWNILSLSFKTIINWKLWNMSYFHKINIKSILIVPDGDLGVLFIAL